MLRALENAKISIKLKIIAIISIALFSILVAWAIYGFHLNTTGLNAIAIAIQRTAIATEAQIGTKEVGVSARNLYLSRTKIESTKAAQKTLFYLKFVDQKLTNLKAIQHTNKFLESIDAVRTLWTKYVKLTQMSINIALKQIDQQAIFFTLGTPLSNATNALLSTIEITNTPTITKIANKIESSINQRQIAIWQYLAAHDLNQIKDFEKQINNFNNLHQELNLNNPSQTIKSKLDSLQSISNEYNKYGREVIRLHQASTDIYFNQATQMRSQAGDLLDVLVKDIVAEENTVINKITATSILTSHVLIGVGIILAMLLLSAMTIVGSMITQPINKLSALMEKLAEGDFNVTIDDTERSDEIGLMARSISNMVKTLGQLLQELRNLIIHTKDGDLSIAENPTQLKGEYAELIVGTNELLKTLTTPLIEIVEVMQHLALGNLKNRMQGTYPGDLQIVKSTVNRSLDDLLSLLKICYRTQELKGRSSQIYDAITKRPRIKRTNKLDN